MGSVMTSSAADIGICIESSESFNLSKSEIIYGLDMRIIQTKIWFHIVKLILARIKSIQSFVYLLKEVMALRRSGMGDIKLRKYSKKGNQYSFSMYAPPWPSKEFDTLINTELDYLLKENRVVSPLHFIFLSITKRCPLQCEHCFEWDIMHQPEKLDLQDLKSIINEFQDKNISSLFLTGGEPLSRYDDLLEIIKYSAPKSKVWIFSSGYSLTKQKAREMKKAGLTGVMISIDHFDEKEHNRFRGSNISFQKAVQAVTNAHNSGLFTTISICVTKEFINERNLSKYMDFASDLEVDFVQFFEPRKAGNYKDKDVTLNNVQVNLLDKFFLGFNNNIANQKHPTIIYQGHHQRNVGCHGGGHRYLYVDSDGNIQSCPFCPNKIGALNNRKMVYSNGNCSVFESSKTINN